MQYVNLMSHQEEDYLQLVHQINQSNYGDQVDKLWSTFLTIIDKSFNLLH
jgi:hypothetical protein